MPTAGTVQCSSAAEAILIKDNCYIAFIPVLRINMIISSKDIDNLKKEKKEAKSFTYTP